MPNRPEFRADKMAGTRFYDLAKAQRVPVGAASAASAVIGVAGTDYTNEVLLHASTRCYVRNTPGADAADNTCIPLEAGEKFHMQISVGDKIAVIQDAAGGFLNIVPVK